MVAFIWMAISAYDVDKEEVKVFAMFSLLLLGAMIAAGLVFSVILFIIRRTTRREGLLGKIESIEKEAARESEAKSKSDSKNN